MSTNVPLAPLTSPPNGAWSIADYFLRLGFFALAPFAIVPLAALFPVRGAIVDVGLALVVFVAGDTVRRWATRSRLLSWLVNEALAFESFYRTRSPRQFLYYLFYPLLIPYWLIHRDARREFLVFRGYTLGGLLVMLAFLAWQYFFRFAPELGWREFLPQVSLALLIEMVLALSLLMPMATTFVWYHGHGHRWRLDILLAVGLMSSSLAFARVANRRDPIVSYAARERVTMRTKANKRKAHRTLLAAVREARKTLLKSPQVDTDGKVMGPPLTAAQVVLQQFYKPDEVPAFDLWASPRKRPRAVALYFEARGQKRPIWVAVDGFGTEIRSPDKLPKGAFRAMHAASDGTEELLEDWPDALELPTISGQK